MPCIPRALQALARKQSFHEHRNLFGTAAVCDILAPDGHFAEGFAKHRNKEAFEIGVLLYGSRQALRQHFSNHSHVFKHCCFCYSLPKPCIFNSYLLHNNCESNSDQCYLYRRRSCLINTNPEPTAQFFAITDDTTMVHDRGPRNSAASAGKHRSHAS